MRSYSARANIVTIHSDLIQVIVIIWPILICWLHTTSGKRIKALRRRLLTGPFTMSWRQLLENTLPYGDVKGNWICTSKRRSSRSCLRDLSDTVSFIHTCTFLVCCPDFCMYVHTHTRTHARMYACMNMRACTHACIYERGWTSRHTQTLTFFFMCRSSGSTNANVFFHVQELQQFHVQELRQSCMCVYDVTHTYLSPNKNEIYWLTHTYTHTHRYACYQGQSRTHGGPTLHSS